jgi:hypothetical protein
MHNWQSQSDRVQPRRLADLRSQAEGVLREVAFVLQATRRVKEAMLRDGPRRRVPTTALVDPDGNQLSIGTRRAK